MTTVAVAKARKAGMWRARGAAGWIGLAASPTFAVMAWIAVTHAPESALCASASDMPTIDGMTWMYLLMSFFHLPSWLKFGSTLKN